MLNNVITIGEESYERFQEFTDRSVYISDDHTVGLPHTITFGRVVPNATASDATAKSRIKLSRSVRNPVTGTVGVITYELNKSQPQWAEESAVASVGTEFFALIANSSVQDNFENQMV